MTLSMVSGLSYRLELKVDAADVHISGNYEYTIDSDDNATITKYTGNESSIVIPSELDGHTVVKLTSSSFAGATAYEVTIPKTVTTMSDYWTAAGALSGSKVTKVIFENGIEAISECALRDTESVTEVSMPETVTEIQDRAFMNCTGLTYIEIPQSIVKIGDSVFAGCTGLTYIDIPQSIVTIGGSAFSGCTGLQTLNLPNGIQSIGDAAFANCPNLLAYCNYFSNAVIACVEQDVSFAPSDQRFSDDENKMIDRSRSMFNANTNSLSANGELPFNIKYSVKNKWQGELSNQTLVAYIPKYTDLREDSIRQNGELAKDYTFDENKRRLTVPVGADSGTLTFSVSVRSKEKIKSYAYLTARKEGVSTTETIGAVNEEFAGISLQADDTTKTGRIEVSGVATPSTKVTFYVDDIEQGSVTALKNGSYSGEVTLENPKDRFSYRIEAKGVDEYENEISAAKNVMYSKSAPELQSLIVEYNEHDVTKRVELVGNNERPTIYYLPNTKFTFKAKFDNPGDIESVYIASTRNNEKMSMEAFYDDASGYYVTDGYFDPENTSYVPGSISVEYNRKHEDA